MPCFLVKKGYVLVDILHLLVRGNPAPSISRTFLLLRWQEAIFIEARFFVELCQCLAQFVHESERSKGIACKSTKMFKK
jgi:hypothetical protein